MAEHKRERYQKRVSAMVMERSSFIPHYKMLSEFTRPRRGRFEVTDRNRGERRHKKIINSRATKALQVATAGMFNGTMSPSRPWFMYAVDDPRLMQFGPAKEWLNLAQETVRRVLNRSNLYGMAPQMIMEELLFGTGCMTQDDDTLAVARFYTHTVGSYVIAQNERGVVDTFAREFEMTVEQIVSKFSRSTDEVSEDISQGVRDQYTRGNYDVWYPVTQFVHPNPDSRRGSALSKDKPFRSVYYEPGNNNRDVFLSKRGYDEFPVYSPRWETTGEDVYGTSCPGMTALGDIRQLQLSERRKAQALEKMVTPPLHGPPSLKNKRVGNLSGNVTTYDPGGDTKGLRPIYEVRLPLGEVTLDIKEVEKRINEAFFVDLFKAISTMEGVQPRNQLELFQRNQERLQELGPVLERQYGDFLAPMLGRTFNQVIRAGLLPPPPPELEDRLLEIRYVSMLALAQQSAVTGNIDRLVAFVSGLRAAGFEEAAIKFDSQQAIDEYAQLVGSPPKLVRDDETVAKIEAEQAQQARQAQVREMIPQLADAAEKVGSIDVSEDTVAGRAADAVNRRSGR